MKRGAISKLDGVFYGYEAGAETGAHYPYYKALRVANLERLVSAILRIV